MAKKSNKKREDDDSESADTSSKLTRKEFEKELYKLQVELTRRGVLDVSHVRPQVFRLEQINEALDSMVARGGGDVHAVRDGWPLRRAAADTLDPHPGPARRRPPLHPR